MRTALVVLTIITFVLLGVLDLSSGEWQTGIASLLLAAVNGLLFTP